jgi:GTPase SAR1 family protein
LNGKKIKLQIWDIGCDKRFRFLFPTYCLGANAALLAYDIYNPHGLDNVSEWVKIVRTKAGNIPIGMVGMLMNEEENRPISRDYAIYKAKKLDLDFYVEISIKTGQNVEKMFHVLTDLIYDIYIDSLEKLENLGMCITVERFNINPSKNTLKSRLYEFLQKLKRLYFK